MQCPASTNHDCQLETPTPAFDTSYISQWCRHAADAEGFTGPSGIMLFY
jgi:hypothetical protein